MNTDTTDLRELAQMAVDGGVYWKERAERAEALLRRFLLPQDDVRPERSYACAYCKAWWLGDLEHHAADCVCTHARVLLTEEHA